MKTLVLTGGGSAGHVSPNLALLPELKRKYALAYIGTDGIERGMLAGAGVPYYTIGLPQARARRAAEKCGPALPLRRGGAAGEARPAGRARGRRVLRGRVCFAARGGRRGQAGAARRFARIGQHGGAGEQAHRPPRRRHDGELFRRGKKTETRRAYGRAAAAGAVRRGQGRGAAKIRLRRREAVLLVFGGGSGSAALNAAVRGALDALTRAYDVLHICGKTAQYPRQRGYVPLPFEKDMAAAYAAADFVLARAGANTFV